MKYSEYNHCDGIRKFSRTLLKEIQSAINDIHVIIEHGAASKIRDEFLNALMVYGWSSELVLSPDSNITITSCKSDVGLCLQTGNMARIYADLLKLQTLYLNGSIKCAAFILPSAPLAKKIGSNIANSDRLERELEIFKKVYNVPTVVFSLEI